MFVSTLVVDSTIDMKMDYGRTIMPHVNIMCAFSCRSFKLKPIEVSVLPNMVPTSQSSIHISVHSFVVFYNVDGTIGGRSGY